MNLSDYVLARNAYSGVSSLPHMYHNAKSQKAQIITAAQAFLATALDIKLIGVSTYSSVRFINVKHTNV